MLVHTSHLTNNIDYLAYKINEYLKILTNEIRKKSSKLLAQITHCKDIISQKSKGYNIPTKIGFNDIYPVLLSTDFSFPLEVISYHSKEYRTDNSGKRSLLHPYKDLIYHDLNDSNRNPRNYIVVGGNRLARGLTLEGLSISYFIRNSSRQDSLHQMGRWFGYRKGYADCVQVFMEGKHIHWYEEIARLERKLRDNFREMNDQKAEPTRWGIQIACSIDNMPEQMRQAYPTDPNKLRHVKKRKISFSGSSFTIRYVKESIHDNNENIEKIEELIHKIDPQFPNNSISCNESYYYKDVRIVDICNFLDHYHFYEDDETEFQNFVTYIRENIKKFNSFSVAIKQAKKSSSQNRFLLINKKLNTNQRSNFQQYNNTSIRKYKSVIEGVIKSRDRIFDLLLDDKDAEDQYKKYKANTKVVPGEIQEWAYELRKRSKNGLLLIIFSHSPPDKKISQHLPVVPLIHLVIPEIKNAKKTEYVLTKKN